MTEWKEYKLGDVCSRLSSGKGIKSDFITTQGKYPVWGGNGVRGYTNTSNFSGRCCIIGRQGAYCGNVHFFEGDAYMTEHAVVAVGNELADSYFLACQLSLMHLENLSAQSAQPGISVKTLSNQIVSLPPLETQRRIAAILSSLDDKIDLLHRENATLELMAETLFRQWFVEEAKEDWEEVPLEYVCERITDGSHYSPESVDLGFPMASVKDMEDWGINLNSCRKISKEEYDKLVSADCLPQVNDILIAKDGSYLKHIFVVNKMQEVVILSSIAIIRPNGLYHPYLLSILLKLDSTKEELKNIVTGAVIPRIVLKDFRQFPILLPPKEKQAQALSFIEPIMRKCFSNNEQIQTLIQTRDGLLPRQMSGEIKI